MVIKVRDVYGKTAYISPIDWYSQKQQLPLYSQGGYRLANLDRTHILRQRQKDIVTIHRNNIVGVA